MNIDSIKNERGQGLIEYIIIVALIAVASIAVMRVMGQNVQGQLARITNGLQGDNSKPRLNKVQKSHYKQRDLSDFIEGAASDDKK